MVFLIYFLFFWLSASLYSFYNAIASRVQNNAKDSQDKEVKLQKYCTGLNLDLILRCILNQRSSVQASGLSADCLPKAALIDACHASAASPDMMLISHKISVRNSEEYC